MIGSWDPNSAQSQELPEAALQSAVKMAEGKALPDAPTDAVKPLQPLMSVSQSVWSEHLTTLESSDLKALCRFFTLAEDQWPDWFGGDRNPVIWICKELKSRGEFPDKDLTAWIKQHSQNRFLPYGNVLG